MKKKINVAVLGTGNIGTDLLQKIFKSKYLNCILFSGRSYSSPGLRKFKKISKYYDKRLIKYRNSPRSVGQININTLEKRIVNLWTHEDIPKKIMKEINIINNFS